MRTGEEMAQPAQTTRRRSAGVVVLAIPLLAVLLLAGVGAAASLRAGARAERVRGLVPYAGALTALVHELQRERDLSTARPPGGPALETARGGVDRAAAAYRDAAVRVEISDRDPQLHQRLDAGLTRLADLAALRAPVDAAGDPAGSVAVFRRYTEVIGGLLAVGSEIGLEEAGQDAGLLRAVSASFALSRAKELADRERAAAAQAAAGAGGVGPAERIRLAAIGGRQDALLDQFATLASPEQLAWYSRYFPDAEVERSVALRRAALEGGSGAAGDLAAWSGSTTARSERMREVEIGLTNEVAREAALAIQSADRRTLAYAAAFLLAASALVVLLVLAPGRARRAATQARPQAARPRPRPSPRPRPRPSPRPRPAICARRTRSRRCRGPRRGSVAEPRRRSCGCPHPPPGGGKGRGPSGGRTGTWPSWPLGLGWPTWPGGARSWSTSSSSCSPWSSATRATRGCRGGCSRSTGWRCGRGAMPTT